MRLFFLGIVFFLLLTELMSQASVPRLFRVRPFDSHVELRWKPSERGNIANYRIYRSGDDGNTFEEIGQADDADTVYIDFIGPEAYDQTFQYQIKAADRFGRLSFPTPALSISTREMTDEAFLNMVQEYTFRYFWEFGHPVSGLSRERNTSGNLVTMGGSGFGIMSILVGIERGFITYEEGLERILTMVTFLEGADRFKGVFPHWMNGETGNVIRFSEFDNGGDIVETAFLLQGLLTARQYFIKPTANEIALRNKITAIWEGVDWNWYRKTNGDVIYWHWSPNHGFRINLPVRGYHEALIVYLLAVASPTNAVPPRLYEEGWAGGNYVNGRTFYGYELPVGPNLGGPLFFAHYSYLGFDPRGIKDAFTNYFVQNTNHTLINRAYCIDNPRGFEGYGENCWGLTASDDPGGYSAHAPNRDNGTITPTAALSSMPYTPDESMAALKHMYRTYGDQIWGPMGFYDAFNLNRDWFARSYLAIDQGPIICMIENYRTGLLWRLFMKNQEIEPALAAIGFTPDTTTTAQTEVVPAENFELSGWPNPASETLNLAYTLKENTTVSMQIVDLNGRIVQQQGQGQRRSPGEYQDRVDVSSLAAGSYYLFFKTEKYTGILPIQIVR